MLLRALVSMACSVLTALVTEAAFAFFMKKGAKFDVEEHVGKFLNSTWVDDCLLSLY